MTNIREKVPMTSSLFVLIVLKFSILLLNEVIRGSTATECPKCSKDKEKKCVGGHLIFDENDQICKLPTERIQISTPIPVQEDGKGYSWKPYYYNLRPQSINTRSQEEWIKFCKTQDISKADKSDQKEKKFVFQHPTMCFKYINCYQSANGSFRATERACDISSELNSVLHFDISTESCKQPKYSKGKPSVLEAPYCVDKSLPKVWGVGWDKKKIKNPCSTNNSTLEAIVHHTTNCNLYFKCVLNGEYTRWLFPDITFVELKDCGKCDSKNLGTWHCPEGLLYYDIRNSKCVLWSQLSSTRRTQCALGLSPPTDESEEISIEELEASSTVEPEASSTVEPEASATVKREASSTDEPEYNYDDHNHSHRPERYYNSTEEPDYDYNNSTDEPDYDYKNSTDDPNYNFKNSTDEPDYNYENSTDEPNYNYKNSTDEPDYDYKNSTDEPDYDFKNSTDEPDYDFKNSTDEPDYNYKNSTDEPDYEYNNSTDESGSNYNDNPTENPVDYNNSTSKTEYASTDQPEEAWTVESYTGSVGQPEYVITNAIQSMSKTKNAMKGSTGRECPKCDKSKDKKCVGGVLIFDEKDKVCKLPTEDIQRAPGIDYKKFSWRPSHDHFHEWIETKVTTEWAKLCKSKIPPKHKTHEVFIIPHPTMCFKSIECSLNKQGSMKATEHTCDQDNDDKVLHMNISPDHKQYECLKPKKQHCKNGPIPKVWGKGWDKTKIKNPCSSFENSTNINTFIPHPSNCQLGYNCIINTPKSIKSWPNVTFVRLYDCGVCDGIGVEGDPWHCPEGHLYVDPKQAKCVLWSQLSSKRRTQCALGIPPRDEFQGQSNDEKHHRLKNAEPV